MDDYATHPDYLALLRGVCEDPADDLPRLVAADWLEENGHGDRAEFIRLGVEQALLPERSSGWWAVQDRIRPLLGNAPPGEYRPKYLEWFARDLPLGVHETTLRRGFVDAVDMAKMAFIGGPCVPCRSVVDTGGRSGCPECGGRGYFDGCAGALFRSHPIAAVTLADAAPDFDPASGMYVWHRVGPYVIADMVAFAATLPDDLHDRLAKPSGRHCGSEGAAAALLGDLSRACVSYGRELAGLPAPREAVPA